MATLPNSNRDGYKPPNWNSLTTPCTFRIIILAGRAAGDGLTCTLRNVTFEQVEGHFLALSYAWGGEDLTDTIFCNGHTVRITKNLHSALRRLRLPEAPLSLWCDALCIKQGNDQASLLERSEQIPLMDRIFSMAIRVVIDLGEDDGTLGQAVEGINAILRTPQDKRARCHLEAEPQTFLKLPEFAHPMWQALGYFMSRPWFQRIWCVQEAVLARDIRAIFGTHSITFEQLVTVASVYRIVSQSAARTYQTRTWDYLKWARPTIATECLVATYQKRKARASVVESHSESLCDLIISTMSQHSTDRRDRVYALYGMVGPQIASDLPVSYSESVSQLSRRVSDYLLRTGNSVWMLVHAGGISPGRPSWTIDLNDLSSRYKADPLISTTKATGENAVYAAGGKTLIQMQANPSHEYIKVRGVFASRITSMAEVIKIPAGPILGEPGHANISPQYIMSVLMWFNSVVVSAEQTSSQYPDALWRTLIANFNPLLDDSHREPNGRPLPGFEAYFDDMLTYAKKIVNADPPLDFNALTAAKYEQIHIPPLAVKFWISMITPLFKRRLVRTGSNGFALVPITSKLNDAIVVFRGVPVPFVLRKDGDGHQVIGISYVHGLMDGEALTQGLQEEDILLR